MNPISPLPGRPGRGDGGEGKRQRQQKNTFELALWSMLRNRNVMGMKFRRQHPLGKYFADFFCPGVKLAIEVDGSSHGSDEAKSHDAARDEWMKAHGIRVLRFSAYDVDTNWEWVRQAIEHALTSPHPRPLSPEDRGEGS